MTGRHSNRTVTVASTLPVSDAPLDFAKLPAGQAMNLPPQKPPQRSGPMLDRLFALAAAGAAWFTLLILVAILLSLLTSAWPALQQFGLAFLTTTTWDPVKEEFGGLVMIYGTLVTSLIALVIAVPVSFGIALFLTELSPAWLKRPLGTAIELLAAVPSIVYGMWGLLVFGPILATYVQKPLQSLLHGVPYLGALVSGPPVGLGLLSAGVILAIMIIPFI
ncbi:MAG: phosphate ABC transporter permease PstC, partial [Betaproteobacteria bacterium]|nr:phosphate ABC transporter permease PstC [Betaproteobacteria bacterium]